MPLGALLMPTDNDTSINEGRRGHRPVQKYSGWASAVAIAITIVIIGLVFYYRARLVGL
jgi:hypothetical protein